MYFEKPTLMGLNFFKHLGLTHKFKNEQNLNTLKK